MGRLFQLSLVILLLSVNSLCAQSWQKLAKLDYPVASMYFFTPEEGFVGTGRVIGFQAVPAKIFHTKNGGITWEEMQVPGGVSGGVLDIRMVDRARGWAAVGQDPINGAVWSTVDSGKSWQRHRIGWEAISVYQNGAVVISPDFFNGVSLSVDSGKTFTRVEPPGGHDAFMAVDFLDSLHGVITSYRADGKWQFTSDGGHTWNATSKSVEAYGVYGMRGTNLFIAAPENNSDEPQKVTTICTSTDFGATWTDGTTLPFVTGGHITGARGVLYVSKSFYSCPSCSEKRDGLFHSLDSGREWTWIGGPANHGDYRFAAVAEDQYCRDVTVYAADDTGNVYKTVDQATGIQATIDSIDRRIVASKSRDTVSVNSNISAHIPVNQFSVDAIEFELEFDPLMVDPLTSEIDHIIPPTGWQLSFSEAIGNKLVTAITHNGGPIALQSPMSLGEVVFGLKKDAKDSTSIRLMNVYLSTTDGKKIACTDTAANILHTAIIPPPQSVGFQNDRASLSLHAFPTPVRGDVLNVKCEFSKPAVLEMIDLLGSVKYRAELNGTSGSEVAIKTTSLSNGPYYLRLSSAGEVLTERVIVTGK